jgi:hypothetical protein
MTRTPTKKRGPPKAAKVPDPRWPPEQKEAAIRHALAQLTETDQQAIRTNLAHALEESALDLRKDILDIARILVPRAIKEAKRGRVRLLRLLQRTYRACRD